MKPNASGLTTGEVAKLIGVGLSTVYRWLESTNGSHLKSYRLPGKRADRRILLHDALDFAYRHKLPADRLERYAHRHGSALPLRCPAVLLVTADDALAGKWLTAGFELTVVPDWFAAGMVLARRSFRAAVLDGDCQGVEKACAWFRSNCQETTAIVLYSDPVAALADLYLSRRLPVAEMVRSVWARLKAGK